MQKYGFDDARDVLERASARETAARVAAGALAKALLAQIGVAIVSHVVQIGQRTGAPRGCARFRATSPGVDESPVRCFDPSAEAEMIAEIKAAAKEGDSLGGTVEVAAYGVPVGLGSHVHWDRKLDGSSPRRLMSIQAVKAVWIGEGSRDRAAPGIERATIRSSSTRAHVSTSGRHRLPVASRAACRQEGSSSPARR